MTILSLSLQQLDQTYVIMWSLHVAMTTNSLRSLLPHSKEEHGVLSVSVCGYTDARVHHQVNSVQRPLGLSCVPVYYTKGGGVVVI